MIQRLKNFRFHTMLTILAVFMGMAAILLMERMGIQVGDIAYRDNMLPPEQTMTAEKAMEGLAPTCLVLTDLGRDDCAEAAGQLRQILTDIKVPARYVDLGSEAAPQSYGSYRTVVVLTPDMDAVGDSLISLFDWVNSGGNVLFAMPMEQGAYTGYVQQKAAVLMAGDYFEPTDYYIDKDFMLGGGQTYAVSDSFTSSIMVSLRPEARVYMRSGDENGVPLVWSVHYGKGRIVVDNIGIYEQAYRGFYSASYSLLEDVSVQPVLNGASVFLDDMPSPVPQGSSEYITRDYNLGIDEFYTTVWFRDIQRLSDQYQMPLIGLVIENYEQDVDGCIEEQQDTARFSYFGNLLLRSGNELGYHGYNHQPLCLDIDYGDAFDYVSWNDLSSIDKGFTELRRFCRQLFPTAQFTVYVPPSNIMSAEGRSYLSSLYPAVKTISGIYLPDDNNDFSYVQEFGVGEDGIVEFPRITSGSILDSYMRMVALSELNMHMVFSHFVHPDDAMDIDRGADIGWPTLYQNFRSFLDWLVESAPNIRRLNSRDLSATIQRWEMLTVDTDIREDTMTIRLGNYLDEAFLSVRFNEASPVRVEGGKLTKLNETLYLLEASQSEITIYLDR